jgi:signal transduction histidine kinase
MDFFQLAPLVAGVGNLLLSLFVLSRDFRSLTNRVFFYWGLCLSVWTLGAFILFHVDNEETALSVARLLHFGVIFLPVLYTHLAVLITDIPMRRVLPWAYGISVFLAFANFTDYFISGVRRAEVVYYAIAGPLYGVLSAMVATLGLLSVWMMLKRRHYPVTGWTIYPLGTFAAFMFPVVVSYSVLQNQLLDIRFTLGRVAAMGVRLMFFFTIGLGLLIIVALLLPGRFTLVTFGASLAVMLVSGWISSVFFPKMLGAGAENLERRILGDRFEYQEQIRAFTDSIPFYTDATRLLEDVEGLISKTLRVHSLHIAILDPQTNQLVVRGECPLSPPPSMKVTLCTSMMEVFRKAPVELLDFRLRQPFPPSSAPSDDALVLLKQLDPELCLPLYSNQEPFGYLLLGRKQSETSYTAQDLESLLSLAKSLSLVMDQIRLKKRVELTEQLEALAVMSRGLAHDLNNLLTPINTYLQLVLSRPIPDPEEEQFLQISSKNMDTIRAYIREAVFFSNTLSPKIGPTSTTRFYADLLSVCRHQLAKRNQSLVCDIPESFDFHSDSILLQRMLSNLVFNAIDASPDGAAITIRAVRLPQAPGKPRWMRIQVIDQGTGISPENLNRVFAPYFTTKNLGDKTRGFGLGLTICQKIVHLHRGTISLQSTQDRGTTVQIDLPADPLEPPATTPLT